MMSGYPSYPAYPAGTPGAPGAQLQLTGPDPVQVAAAEPAGQRRATVAFRLILVVPHMFLLFFLGIAALVVAFLGWWGALFTGRLPEFAVNYLSGFMRWVLRYQAYLYLLTDVYPPFTLDDVPEYPVRLAIPERQRLTRATVFFRFILAIPGIIVSAVATEGASSLVLFVAWLIALVNGHLPRPLHQALTALLRYQIRFYCYYWMLTPAYPWGLFGDAPGMPPAAAGYAAQDGGYGAPPPGYGTAPGYSAGPGFGGAPGYGNPGYGNSGYGNPGYTPGYGTPASVYGAPGGYGYGAPGGYGGPGGYGAPGGYGPGQTVFQPASWQLVLSRGARQLVILFLVLGVIMGIFNGAGNALSLSRALQRAQDVNTANNAINTVNSSYGTLTTKMNQWHYTVSACDKNLTCVTKADASAATYFSAFASELRVTPMPSGATAAANQVFSDATRVAQNYAQLSQAANVATYQDTFTRLGLQQSLNRFDQDFNALGAALDNS
jgi:preprotein translocase subunit SecG